MFEAKHHQLFRIINISTLILIGCAASIILWTHTPYGMNIGHDSLFYFSAADNLSSGAGLYWTGSGGELKPLTVFAPLYPILLSGLNWISPSVEISARGLAVVLFGLNTAMIGLIVYYFSRRWFAGLIGGLLAMASPVLIMNHLGAMTEPLFYLTTFTGLALLATYIYKPSRWKFSFIILCSAAAFFSRYTGSSLVLATALSLLFLQRKPFVPKLRGIFIYVFFAVLPIGLFMARNYLLTGLTSNRTFRVHLIDADRIRQFLDVIYSWVSPNIMSHWLETIGLFFLFAIIVIYAVRHILVQDTKRIEASYLLLTLVIFSLSYVLLLMISLSFFDAHTRVDDRQLSPLYLALFVSILIMIAVVPRKPWHQVLPLLIAVLMVMSPLPYMLERSDALLSRMRSSGAGFGTPAWKNSHVIQWIQGLNHEASIITDQAMVVDFLTGNHAYQLPERYDPVKEMERPTYAQDLSMAVDVLDQPNSYLVLFKGDFSPFERTDAFMQAFKLLLDFPEAEVYILNN